MSSGSPQQPYPYSNPYSSAGPGQQQQPPQGYTPYPEYQGYPQPQQYNYGIQNPIQRAGVNGRAIASMFLSILSVGIGFFSLIFSLCGIIVPVLSVPGMILGKMEMNAIRQGKGLQSGEIPAKIGFYVGLVSTIFFVLGFLVIALFIILGIAGALAS